MAKYMFKPGDKVRDFEGTEYTVEDEPRTAYKIRNRGDEAMWFPAEGLSPIPSADPRVDVVARLVCDGMNGEGTWAETDGPSIRFFQDDARAILAALDAMSSDKDKPDPARWIDRCRDIWEKRPEDSPAEERYSNLRRTHGPHHHARHHHR